VSRALAVWIALHAIMELYSVVIAATAIKLDLLPRLSKTHDPGFMDRMLVAKIMVFAALVAASIVFWTKAEFLGSRILTASHDPEWPMPRGNELQAALVSAVCIGLGIVGLWGAADTWIMNRTLEYQGLAHTILYGSWHEDAIRATFGFVSFLLCRNAAWIRGSLRSAVSNVNQVD